MNLIDALFRRPKAKGGSSYGGGYGGNYRSGGAAYSDEFRKDRAPQPLELIRQLVGLAYGCVNINANAVASTPLRLYVRTGKGQRKTRWQTSPVNRKTLKYLRGQKETASFVSDSTQIEEVHDHPVLTLLDLNQAAPQVDDGDYSDTRPSLSGYQLFKLTQIFLEAMGKAYWLKELDGLGVPKKLWLLRPHFVRESFSPDGSGRIDYYEYGGPSGARYSPDQIIRFCDPDPYNPYLGGMAPLIAAIEKIRIFRRQDAHVNAILENAARPDAIWSPKGDSEGGGIGPAEARRMEVAINQKFREAGNGSIMVQPYPGTMQVIGWKPGDIVELERAKQLEQDIKAIFGVPDAILNRNNTTVAGAKTSDYAYGKYTIQPRLRNIGSTLRVLLRDYDPDNRLFFAFDDALPEDSVFELEQTRVGATTGAVEIDEIRTALDLQPYGNEQGRTRYIASDLTPIGPDGQVIDNGSAALARTNPPPIGNDPNKKSLEELTQKKTAAMEAGHWVTMGSGQHVYISDSSGEILKGPAGMIGKKPENISKHHYNHTNPSKPPNRTNEEAPGKSAKSQIAKQSATYVGKDIQRYAEENNEPKFAKAIGGLSYDDNEPVDVVAGKGGIVRDGVELKTMVSNKASKLTMDKYAQVRKVVWEQEKSATFHTVVIDDRAVYNAGGDGEHDESARSYYYRRGIAGSARIESMHKCKNIGEVKKLMGADETSLPDGAKRTDGKIRTGKWKAFVDKAGKGFKNSKTGEIVRPKK